MLPFPDPRKDSRGSLSVYLGLDFAAGERHSGREEFVGFGVIA